MPATLISAPAARRFATVSIFDDQTLDAAPWAASGTRQRATIDRYLDRGWRLVSVARAEHGALCVAFYERTLRNLDDWCASVVLTVQADGTYQIDDE